MYLHTYLIIITTSSRCMARRPLRRAALADNSRLYYSRYSTDFTATRHRLPDGAAGAVRSRFHIFTFSVFCLHLLSYSTFFMNLHLIKTVTEDNTSPINLNRSFFYGFSVSSKSKARNKWYDTIRYKSRGLCKTGCIPRPDT